MLDVQDALKLLLDAVAPLEAVEVALAEALSKTLAETALADRDFPSTDRSAMDGFAVRAADGLEAGRSLVVRGEVRAGQDPAAISVGAGEAVRIFTGAVIPRGADAVVMVEATAEDRASRTVTVNERTVPGQHVRRRGEAIRGGAAVVEAGAIVGPAEIAALAAVGRTRVRVVRTPRVAVLSTGDEVVEADTVPAPHQIRNSNAAMLLAQLTDLGVEARYLGIAGDEPDALATLIEDGLGADVLILTGGVSVGEYDFVGAALLRAGCTVLFHTVAMRPGKPILAAQRGRCVVMGLPGNPVSAFTGFHVFVAPALGKLMGRPRPAAGTVRAALLAPLHRKPGRLTYHLAQLRWKDGRPVVAPVPSSSSGDVLSLVAADAFIVAPGDARAIPTGDEVDVLPFWGQVLR